MRAVIGQERGRPLPPVTHGAGRLGWRRHRLRRHPRLHELPAALNEEASVRAVLTELGAAPDALHQAAIARHIAPIPAASLRADIAPIAAVVAPAAIILVTFEVAAATVAVCQAVPAAADAVVALGAIAAIPVSVTLLAHPATRRAGTGRGGKPGGDGPRPGSDRGPAR